MIAYCWANGVVEFGRKLPKDALPIVNGPAKQVRGLMSAVARHAYDGKTLLVPGIPEAASENAAVDALRAFNSWLHSRLPVGVRPKLDPKVTS